MPVAPPESLSQQASVITLFCLPCLSVSHLIASQSCLFLQASCLGWWIRFCLPTHTLFTKALLLNNIRLLGINDISLALNMFLSSVSVNCTGKLNSKPLD